MTQGEKHMNRIYQIAMKNGSTKDAWIDVDEADYASAGLYDEYKQIGRAHV